MNTHSNTVTIHQTEINNDTDDLCALVKAVRWVLAEAICPQKSAPDYPKGFILREHPLLSNCAGDSGHTHQNDVSHLLQTTLLAAGTLARTITLQFGPGQKRNSG